MIHGFEGMGYLVLGVWATRYMVSEVWVQDTGA